MLARRAVWSGGQFKLFPYFSVQHLPSLMSYVLAKQLSEGVYQYRLRKFPRNGGCMQEGLVG